MTPKLFVENIVLHPRPFEYQTKLTAIDVVNRLHSVMDKSSYKPFGSVTLDGIVTESEISLMRYGMGQRRIKYNALLVPTEDGVLLVGNFQNTGAPMGIAILMLLVLGWSLYSGGALLISGSHLNGLQTVLGGMFFSAGGILMSRVFFWLLNTPDIRNIQVTLEESLGNT